MNADLARLERETGVFPGRHPRRYGTFLCRVFDRWIQDIGGPKQTSVRTFEALLAHYLGQTPPECTMHTTCDSYLVVEHDGAVYPCDFFVEPGWELGNITTSHLATLWRSPNRLAFSVRKAELPQACKECEWLSVCRGGCPKDRVQGGPPRTNHLCAAYRALFAHAHDRLTALTDQLSRQNARATTGVGLRRIGRNDPCPCGSKAKYKKCCGRA